MLPDFHNLDKLKLDIHVENREIFSISNLIHLGLVTLKYISYKWNIETIKLNLSKKSPFYDLVSDLIIPI